MTHETASTDFYIYENNVLLFYPAHPATLIYHKPCSPHEISAAWHAYLQAVHTHPAVGSIKRLRFPLQTKRVNEKADCIITLGNNNSPLHIDIITENISAWRKKRYIIKPLQKLLRPLQDAPPIFTENNTITLHQLAQTLSTYTALDDKPQKYTLTLQLDPTTHCEIFIKLNKTKSAIEKLTVTINPNDFGVEVETNIVRAVKKQIPASKIHFDLRDYTPPKSIYETLYLNGELLADENQRIYLPSLSHYKTLTEVDKHFDQLRENYARRKIQRLRNHKRHNIYQHISLDHKETLRQLSPKNFIVDLTLHLDNTSWFAKKFGQSAKAYKNLNTRLGELKATWIKEQAANAKKNRIKYLDNTALIDKVFRSEKEIKVYLSKTFSLSWRQRRKYFSIFHSTQQAAEHPSPHTTLAAHYLAISCVQTAAPAA